MSNHPDRVGDEENPNLKWRTDFSLVRGGRLGLPRHQIAGTWSRYRGDIFSGNQNHMNHLGLSEDQIEAFESDHEFVCLIAEYPWNKVTDSSHLGKYVNAAIQHQCYSHAMRGLEADEIQESKFITELGPQVERAEKTGGFMGLRRTPEEKIRLELIKKEQKAARQRLESTRTKILEEQSTIYELINERDSNYVQCFIKFTTKLEFRNNVIKYLYKLNKLKFHPKTDVNLHI
jgi:hypothetical protein